MTDTPAMEAVVKPLEWDEDTSPREDGPSDAAGDWSVWTFLGELAVNFDTDEEMAQTPYCAWTVDGSLGHFGTLDEAKAAVQADTKFAPSPPSPVLSSSRSVADEAVRRVEAERDEALQAKAALSPDIAGLIEDGDHYLKTHGDNCRTAMLIAKDHAEVSPPDIDDKSYWDHEIAALEAALSRINQPKQDDAVRGDATLRYLQNVLSDQDEFEGIGDLSTERQHIIAGHMWAAIRTAIAALSAVEAKVAELEAEKARMVAALLSAKTLAQGVARGRIPEGAEALLEAIAALTNKEG
jgi:hypothetical protein